MTCVWAEKFKFINHKGIRMRKNTQNRITRRREKFIAHLSKLNLKQAKAINQEHRVKIATRAASPLHVHYIGERRKKKKGCAAHQQQHFEFSGADINKTQPVLCAASTPPVYRARICIYFAAKVSIKLSPGIKQLSGGELAIIAQHGVRAGVLKTLQMCFLSLPPLKT